jgi:hypothetical protein
MPRPGERMNQTQAGARMWLPAGRLFEVLDDEPHGGAWQAL